MARVHFLVTALLITIPRAPLVAQGMPSAPPAGAPACFEAAYNAKDAARVADCFADTVAVYSVLPDSVHVLHWTRADIPSIYGHIFDRMPKAHQVTLGALSTGSYFAVHERLDEISPGVSATGLTVYRSVGGKITGLWSFSN